MQTKLKIIIFLIVAAILAAVAVVGYNAYLGQTTKPGVPYKTSLEPTATTTSTDRTTNIENELNATTMSDLEIELKSLEDESAGL